MDYCRSFQMTLVSANNLEDVRRFFRMKVYARVSINNIPKTEKRTQLDKHGGSNPAWSSQVRYTVGESAVQHQGVMVVIKLYCKRKLGDMYIGEVHKSMAELFHVACRNGGGAMLRCEVQRGSKKSQGCLNFSFRFGEVEMVERSPRWKRLLRSGAVVLLRLSLLSALGVDVPIPIFVGRDAFDAV